MSTVTRNHESVQIPVTAANAVYTRPSNASQRDENPIRVRVVSDVPMHVAYNRPAITSDAFIPANTKELLTVGPNDILNFIRTGGTDGTAWVTVVSLS